MSRPTRMILLTAAAVAALGQSKGLSARALSCQTPIYWSGGGGAPAGSYTLQYECGESWPGGACYRGQNLQYYVFNCTTEAPGGGGCDPFSCWIQR